MWVLRFPSIIPLPYSSRSRKEARRGDVLEIRSATHRPTRPFVAARDATLKHVAKGTLPCLTFVPTDTIKGSTCVDSSCIYSSAWENVYSNPHHLATLVTPEKAKGSTEKEKFRSKGRKRLCLSKGTGLDESSECHSPN